MAKSSWALALLILVTSAFVFGLAPTASAGNGEPDCASVSPCTKMLEDASYTAAVQFNMLGAGTAPITAALWDTRLECPDAPDLQMTRVLSFDDGPNSVPIRFFPPLTEGDTVSVQWSVGGCPTTPCTLYVIPPVIEQARPPACY